MSAFASTEIWSTSSTARSAAGSGMCGFIVEGSARLCVGVGSIERDVERRRQTLEIDDTTCIELFSDKRDLVGVTRERLRVELMHRSASVSDGDARPVRRKLRLVPDQLVGDKPSELVAKVERERPVLVDDEVVAEVDTEELLQEEGRLLQVRLAAPTSCSRICSTSSVSSAARCRRFIRPPPLPSQPQRQPR